MDKNDQNEVIATDLALLEVELSNKPMETIDDIMRQYIIIDKKIDAIIAKIRERRGNYVKN
jgi:hypothetical protein